MPEWKLTQRRLTQLDDTTVKAIVAMGCITVLELSAILAGIDGAYLALVVGALAGLGGYEVAKRRQSQVVS